VKNRLVMSLQTVALVACSSFCFNAVAQANWEPTKSVEFIVPAGTGGGADQMARFLQGVISKHKIMAHPLVVGGCRCRRFFGCQGGSPRWPQDHHHAVKFIHHAFGNGCALQLEGPDPCCHVGTR